MSLTHKTWNVVATVNPSHFDPGKFDLSEFGTVGETDIHRLLVVEVPDVDELLEKLEAKLHEPHSNFFAAVPVVRPVRRQFVFEETNDFWPKLERAARELSPALEGRVFRVCVSSFGADRALTAETVRSPLRDRLLAHLADTETRAASDDESPEVVLDLEVVEDTAGLAAWTRRELARYPFLRLP